MRYILPSILLLLLSACSLAPQYTRPDMPVDHDWPQGPAYQSQPGTEQANSMAETSWKDYFADARLHRLIALALENNRDLRAAVLNVERLQALYRVRRADLLPQVDARGTGSGQGVPADLSGTGSHITRHQYGVDLSVSAYELDLFGRVRNLKDEAFEALLAEEETQRSVQILLVSQVVQSWLELAADRDLLQLSHETLANQTEALHLIESRFNAGIASSLAVQQARTSVEQARVDVARNTTRVSQDENALRLLLGTDLPPELYPDALPAMVTATAEVSPGLNSEVLLQRPDILAAEHQLRGAHASIGAARAAFFPRITLTSSIGTGSDELSGLFKGNNNAWSFAPTITLPIFSAGRNSANLAVAKVDREIAVTRYEKAIQTAFREVADALARQGTIDEQLAAQQSLTDAINKSYQLSLARYEKGIDSYLSVLDSQRSLYTARQNLLGTRLTRLNNLVTLYQVLGGGASN